MIYDSSIVILYHVQKSDGVANRKLLDVIKNGPSFLLTFRKILKVQQIFLIYDKRLTI